jgi:hypothetical protein
VVLRDARAGGLPKSFGFPPVEHDNTPQEQTCNA